jgi:hypothetical protein
MQIPHSVVPLSRFTVRQNNGRIRLDMNTYCNAAKLFAEKLGGTGKLFCTMHFLPELPSRADWSRGVNASVTRQNASFSLAFYAAML